MAELTFRASLRRIASATDFEGNPYLNISLHAAAGNVDVTELMSRLSKDKTYEVTFSFDGWQPPLIQQTPTSKTAEVPVDAEKPAKRSPGRPRKSEPSSKGNGNSSDAQANAIAAIGSVVGAVGDYLKHKRGDCSHTTTAACDAAEKSRLGLLDELVGIASERITEAGLIPPDPVRPLLDQTSAWLDAENTTEEQDAAMLNALQGAQEGAAAWVTAVESGATSAVPS